MRRPTLTILLLLASCLASASSVVRRPFLLRFVGSDSLTADLLVAGTTTEPIYLFRDPDGHKLKVERKGDWDHGFTLTYSYVGAERGYVQIRDLFVFHLQGLPYRPMIITINGRTIAGYLDDDVETKRLGKKVYAEYKRLPLNFQRVLYNLYIFGENLHGVKIPDAQDVSQDVGVLLSEDWNSPSLPDYKAEVLMADPKDENAVPAFQRLFVE